MAIEGVMGNPITMTWIDLVPVTQVYGILFNDKKEVLVLQRADGKMTLPGGKPEEGENIYQTLERETMEEANVTVKNLMLLGANQIDDSQNPDPTRKQYFQIRLMGEVNKELEEKVDPASGEQMRRRYFPLDELNTVLQWGAVGEAMVETIKKIKSGV